MREKGLGRKKPLTILLQIAGIGVSGTGIAADLAYTRIVIASASSLVNERYFGDAVWHYLQARGKH